MNITLGECRRIDSLAERARKSGQDLGADMGARVRELPRLPRCVKVENVDGGRYNGNNGQDVHVRQRRGKKGCYVGDGKMRGRVQGVASI